MSSVTDPASCSLPGFTIELERDGRVLRVTWLGDVTLAVMKNGFARTRQIAKGRALQGAISDFTYIDTLKLSAGDIYALTEERPVFETDIPRVTVSGREHVFGMARMFELVSDGRKTGIHVVRTIEEAYSLLNLENPEFFPVTT